MQEKKKLYQRILSWIGCHHVVFYILSFTWGFITSFIGLLIMIPFLITKKVKTFHGRLYGIFPEFFGDGWGFEMGCFFFVSHDCDEDARMNSHESGHGLQNIIWGPLMLFVISIPSMIRFYYRQHLESKGVILKPYDSIWFEGQASNWGWEYVHMSNLKRQHDKELKNYEKRN